MQPLQRDSRPAGRPVRRALRALASALTFSVLCGCSSTSFVATWKAPNMTPIEREGSRVAAVVMVKNETMRRAAEDRLASEISSRGAQGIAMYRLVLETGMPSDEPKVRAMLESQHIAGVVVMRPISIETEWVATPSTYGDPYHSGYWGGYYGYGWGHPYGDVEVHANKIVSIETLLYSLPQNKLLWGGQSKTTNPQNVDDLVAEVAEAAARELEYDGVIAKH